MRTVAGNVMTLKCEHGELTVTTEMKDDTAQMKLSGGVYLATANDLMDEVEALLSAGRHVVINCSELTGFPHNASEKLVKVYRRAAVPMNRRVEMCGVPAAIFAQLQAADVDMIISDVRQEV